MILRTLVLLLLAASCAAAQPIPDTLRAPAEADSITVYGWTVDADADRVLVGARVWPPPYPRVSGRGAPSANMADHHGTVFVYRQQSSGEWMVEGRLKADYISNEDCFGWSMDLRGDIAVIGAHCEVAQTGEGWYSGAVYMFRYDGETWVRDGKLFFPFAEDEVFSVYRFGESVTVGDDYFAVGTGAVRNPANPEEDYYSGAVYVFEREGSAWTLATTLTNDDADDQINEYFGGAVAVAGTSVLASALSESGPETEFRGAVYVFEKSGDAWVQTDKLTAPVPESDRFGALLAAEAGKAVVGSWTAVYPVERTESGWTVEPAFEIDIRPNGVARAAGRILTVDVRASVENGYDGYLFEKAGAGWVETRIPSESYTASRDEMVSLTSTHAFIGSPEAFGGEVLVYDLGLATSSEQPLPDEAALALAIAPNPMRRDGTVRFELEEPGNVRLMVYDVLGREVMQLMEEARTAGEQVVDLDASGFAPGIYVLRLQTERQAVTQRFTVVR